MEEAINIDHDIHGLAEELKQTSREVTGLAVATALQAQESAERTQAAIEATFAAAEKAFETVKKAGYVLDKTKFNPQLSSDELSQELAKIRDKNQRLKEANNVIKERLAALKQ